jgi:hypothetical protein
VVRLTDVNNVSLSSSRKWSEVIETDVWIGPIVTASGTILNPWYVYPVRVKITLPSRLDLGKHGITLFFRDNQVWSTFSEKAMSCVFKAIHPYLLYRSFLNYNVWHLPKSRDNEDFEDVEIVRFNLKRLVRMEQNEKSGDSIGSCPYLEERNASVEVSSNDLSLYLQVLDESLGRAIEFYLQGCYNERYFLVEFYKAIEAIKHAFKCESEFLDSLKPHGITKKGYKMLTRVCSEETGEPIETARHAPRLGARPYPANLRYLLVDTRLYGTFELATTECRAVIDAYIKFLAATQRPTSAS